MDVYLELGSKRVGAAALQWPGLWRSGRSEEQALQALIDAAPRYATVVALAALPFDAPQHLRDFSVALRLPGNAATDFGALGVMPPGDAEPLDSAGAQRLAAILSACWEAFDRTAEAARGKELAKGPRGGGRDLDGVARHVLDSEASYAVRIGLKLGPVAPDDASAVAARRHAILDTMAEIAPLGAPPPGPRGGARWPASYFARVVAYHVLDHAWEIEDRSGSAPQPRAATPPPTKE